jgi:hypothetical protein
VSLSSIIAEIERRAQHRQIGRLQQIRKGLKRRSRLAGTSIFNSRTTFGEDYAYHYGGREELQFNVGRDKPGMFRHGVAFSFEPSRTLPNPEEALLSSVRRFNEFIQLHPAEFSDMSMWDWEWKQRKDSDRAVGPIGPELMRRGMFIFIGKMQPTASIDFDIIVDDLDRLLGMYQFVEGRDAFPTVNGSIDEEDFRPGCTVKRRFTTASLAEKILNIDFRHTELQFLLYEELQKEYGENNVTTEWKTPTGNVDVAVRRADGRLWFYEIKTSLSARACIREGLGQILEYSYWQRGKEPEKLFIVGEPPLDSEADEYLTLLRQRFAIPIQYRQCILA